MHLCRHQSSSKGSFCCQSQDFWSFGRRIRNHPISSQLPCFLLSERAFGGNLGTAMIVTLVSSDYSLNLHVHSFSIGGRTRQRRMIFAFSEGPWSPVWETLSGCSQLWSPPTFAEEACSWITSGLHHQLPVTWPNSTGVKTAFQRLSLAHSCRKAIHCCSTSCRHLKPHLSASNAPFLPALIAGLPVSPCTRKSD